MYTILPIVCNIGQDVIRERVAACNGLVLAERCAYLNAAVTDALWTRGIHEAQVRFIELLGDDPNRDEVVRSLVGNRETVIADPMNLETLCAFAVAVGTGDRNLDRFLETLMALTFETLREPGTEEMRYDPEGMYSAVNNTMTFGTERYLNTRWRIRQFVEWSRTVRDHHAHIDLDAAFVATFGMSYEELIVAIEIIHLLGDFTVMHDRRRASFDIAELRSWDRTGRVVSILKRISITGQELTEIIVRTPLHDLRNELVRTFLTKPVIAVDDDRFLIPSGRLADNLASMGLVYAIADPLREQSAQLSARLWAFFGYFYEWYIATILERSAQRSGGEVWREQNLDGLRTADAIVRQVGEVQIFEIVSSRPNANLLRRPGDEEAVATELERLVLAKVDQLADNVRRFIDGGYAVFGADVRDGDAIYPVVVQYKSFLRTDAFHEQVQQRFRDRLGEASPMVREVEMLDAEALEGLEEHLSASMTLGRLIDEKGADGAMRSALFKNFLAISHPEMPLRYAPDIQIANDRWHEEIGVALMRWRRG